MNYPGEPLTSDEIFFPNSKHHPMKFEKVKPTNQSREDIEALASQIAEKLSLRPGCDLRPVVERLGGKLEVHPWDEPEQAGSVEVRGPENFTIYLSPFTGHYRDRFTIAHELGHYFLHSLVGKHHIRIAREGSNRAEWEANWFAAGFLMPEAEFRQKWNELGGSMEAMANAFDVSPQTIRVRAQTLGLV